MHKLLTVAFSSLLFLAAIPASGDDWNKKTTVTFGQPVEVPGMVLPAGKYVFKLADSTSDRHIVLIYNAEETRLLKIVLAIDNFRLTPTGKPVLTFAERAKDTPEALRAWFFPGDTWGQEFVYPKARARAIAETASTPVLSAAVEPTEEPDFLINEPVERVTPEAKAVETIEPTFENPEPTALAEEAAAEPAPAIAEAAPPAEALPQTGSKLPLIGLLGAAAATLGGLMKLLPRNTR